MQEAVSSMTRALWRNDWGLLAGHRAAALDLATLSFHNLPILDTAHRFNAIAIIWL